MFEALTMYLPLLKNDGHGRLVTEKERDGSPGPRHLPFIKYSDTAYKLMHAISAFVDGNSALDLYDYLEIMKKAGIDDPKKADVSHLDGRTVAALIVAAWRAERFCDGAFYGCLKDGHMEKWLERLLELDTAANARSFDPEGRQKEERTDISSRDRELNY